MDAAGLSTQSRQLGFRSALTTTRLRSPGEGTGETDYEMGVAVCLVGVHCAETDPRCVPTVSTALWNSQRLLIPFLERRRGRPRNRRESCARRQRLPAVGSRLRTARVEREPVRANAGG